MYLLKKGFIFHVLFHGVVRALKHKAETRDDDTSRNLVRLRFRTAVLKTHYSRVWGWRRTDETAGEGDGRGKNVS